MFQLSLDRFYFVNSCCYIFCPLTDCPVTALSTAVIASDLAHESTFYISCRSVLPTDGCQGLRSYISFMMNSVKFWFCLIVVLTDPPTPPGLCVTNTGFILGRNHQWWNVLFSINLRKYLSFKYLLENFIFIVFAPKKYIFTVQGFHRLLYNYTFRLI